MVQLTTMKLSKENRGIQMTDILFRVVFIVICGLGLYTMATELTNGIEFAICITFGYGLIIATKDWWETCVRWKYERRGK